VPAPGTSLADAAHTDAVRLFLDRAALVRSGTSIDDGEGDAVVEICRRLDGLPLAIELAAARLTMLSPTRIAAGLDDRFRLLTGGGRAARARHQTLHACVAWSYGLLTGDEQHLLDLLSVFRESCSLDAVEAVVADELAPDLVFDLLDRLVRKSLVVADPAPDGTRFRLLETISAFAADRLADRGGTDAARDRHLVYFSRSVDEAEPELTGVDQDRWLRSLRTDQANVRAALERAAEQADTPAGAAALWAMVGGLTFYWSTTGRFRDARSWFEQCLAHATAPDRAQLPARWGAAHVALYGGDFGSGLAFASGAYELAARLDDTRYAARALNSLGTAELFIDVSAGLAKQERAVELATAAHDDWCLADALQAAAYGDAFCYRLDAAAARLDRARPIAARLDHPLLLAWDRIGQALVAVLSGEVTAAQAILPDAAIQTERTRDPNLAMNLLVARAMTAFLAGDGRAWLGELDQALHDAPRIGAGEAAPMIAPFLATLLLAHGEVGRAHAVLDDHLPIITAFTPALAARVLQIAAVAALAADDPRQARDRIDAALVAGGSPQSSGFPAILEVTAALVAVREGDLGRAERTARRAVPAIAGVGAWAATVDALEALAVVLEATDDLVGAARAIGAARRLRAAHGIVRSELDVLTRHTVQRSVTWAGANPDGRAALAEGEAAPLADTVAQVQRSRGARRRPTLGWDSLTPTELQVVALVAEGSTNAQVAARLFVSSETVKTHLSHVYTKLDVPNRAALSAAYVRRAAGPADD
jgi:DNA-binding CsgD family transcriptional regulator